MANIKSAIKRVNTTEKKTMRNKSLYSAMQTAIKKFNAAIADNNVEEAQKLLSETYSIIDGTAASGVIHKNNAARRKSKIACRLDDLKSGRIVVAAKVDNKARAAEKAAAKAAEIEKARALQAEKAEAAKAKRAAAAKTDAKDKKGDKRASKEVVKEQKKAAKTEKVKKLSDKEKDLL